MKLIFRSHTNTPEEIQLGHKLGFTTIKGIDAISASANLNGFTPAAAVLRHLGYDKDQFQQMADYSRANGSVELYAGRKPNLIFVPPTRGYTGKNKSMEFYITRTLQICNAENYKSLHFSHFGFINGEFQQLDIFKIFNVLLNPLIYTTLDVFYWEIDSRYLDRILDSYRYVNNDCYRNRSGRPEVIQAPEFEYVDYMSNSDGTYWKEFKQKRIVET
jgi:hypothetical protein